MLFQEAQGRIGDKGDAMVVDWEDDSKTALLVPPPPAEARPFRPHPTEESPLPMQRAVCLVSCHRLYSPSCALS